jgi:putative transposase
MKSAMLNVSGLARSHERWARFRFSVIGPLLAAPPERGELQEQLKSLATKKWHHPITGQRVQFGLSTIERWFYTARNAKRDPVQALRRKIRSDHGQHPSLTSKFRELLVNQYRQHPNWSYQLHADNLAVLIEREPTLGATPSYASVVRFMKVHGLIKRPRRGPVHSPGAQATEHRIETREIRSYESQYVNALWHLDFHHGSLRVLLDKGRWVYPLLLGIIDDHSRLCCHAQWYLAEGAEELCHGLCQAFQKRALPRALMSDNGSAMLAAETTEGLAGLSIVHETTLPYAPFQKE